MSGDTILWQDFETSGLDVRRDRPIQFAGLRTDLELNEIEEPVCWRARLNDDVLPEPDACLITRQIPGVVPAEGEGVEWLPEWQLAQRLNELARVPGTCHAGYNSIRFDAEVARFTFWRHLLPIYDHEWRDGNSRWDLLDPMRAACALRPDGIEWPERDGFPGFRLEDLTAANGIEHGDAHDAVADVRATVAMARLLRDSQPRLFDYLLSLRRKPAVAKVVQAGEPFVHTSRVFPRESRCTSVVHSLGEQRDRRGQFVVWDLRHPPEVLLELDTERLRELMYTRRADRDPDAPQVALKTIRLNRSPVVAPLAVLRHGAGDWDRIEFDPAIVEPRAQWLDQHAAQLRRKVDALLERREETVLDDDGEPLPPAEPDVEEALYDAFVSDGDARRARATWRDLSAKSLCSLEDNVDDDRLRELAFRLRGAAFPGDLDDDDLGRWREHCRERLLVPTAPGVASRVEQVRGRIAELRGGAELRGRPVGDADELRLLAALEEFVNARCAALDADD